VTQAQPAVSALGADCVRLRAPLREIDLVLSRVAEVWLMSLPRLLRPAHLCVAYPRVVNRLALCWDDQSLTEHLLDDLLIGRRGNRKGFPRPVAEELMRLRRLHDSRREIDAEEAVWERRSLVPSASTVELMRGLQVSEDFIDTLPGELADELFKR